MKKIYSFIIIAMAALVSAPVFTSCTDDNGQEQTGEVDTTELEAALEECQALLDDATTTDYPEEAITTFQETVDAVNEALAAGGLTQTVVNNLLANLNAARDTFEEVLLHTRPSLLQVRLRFTEATLHFLNSWKA